MRTLAGGVQAGCDYQFAGGFVIGIQGDYAWSNAEGPMTARALGVRYHSKSGRWHPSLVVSATPGRFLGYVKAVAPGNARILGDHDRPRDCLHGA